ncbi:MAG: hypothetical protein JXA25_13220 [Anaerolineales bacterium]|nr:hypothetical protein [Anaerolineales bacterium]
MKVEAITCPACSGRIDWDSQETRFRCGYCGTLLHVENLPGQSRNPSIAETLEANHNLSRKLLALFGLQADIRGLWRQRRNWGQEKRFRALRKEEAILLGEVKSLRGSLTAVSGINPGSRPVRIEPVDVESEIDESRGILSIIVVFFFGGITMVPFILLDQFITRLFNMNSPLPLFTLLGSLVYLSLCIVAFFYFRRKEHTIYSLVLDLAELVMRKIRKAA